MKSLQDMLLEDRSESVDKGCLMADVSKPVAESLIKFGKKIVPEQDLYVQDGEFGRETNVHVTIRYGFIKDLNEIEIRQIIGKQPPFKVTLTGLSIFETDEYDVVKFDVQSEILTKWNSLSGMYPNENEFPNYHPHITVAYVKKGTFTNSRDDLNIEVPIDRICYSPISGGKSHFNLSENVTKHTIDKKIERLEQEWERLDSMGMSKSRQNDIAQELQSLKNERDKQWVEPDTNHSNDLFKQMRAAVV